MNKLAVAVSIFSIGTVSASAADLAARPYTKAPPPAVVAAYDWSGFYIGANGGGAWSRKCWAMVYDPALFIPALLNYSERIRQDVDMVTARINYRFGGPVVAKY